MRPLCCASALAAGQEHVESSATPQLGFDLDVTAGLANDRVECCETETETALFGLGREERLEHLSSVQAM
jgi:hypothetical protein